DVRPGEADFRPPSDPVRPSEVVMRPMALLVVLSLAALSQADDTYTIKIKVDPDVGRTVNFRSISKCTGGVRALDADGIVVSERKPDGSETAVRKTVLEVGKDGRPTKYILSYELATEANDGTTDSLSYQGRMLLFETRDGRTRLGVVGDPPLDTDDIAS